MVKITGGQRIDLLGVRQGGPAGGVEGPRHAVGLRLRQVVPDGQDVRRHRVLPLRPRATRRARHRARGALQGPGEPGQAQARRRGLPAQLLRGDGQGRRLRRGGGRALGDVRRRRGRRARAQGRPALHARHRTRRRCCMAGRFMQYYREHAKWLERTYRSWSGSASTRCARSSSRTATAIAARLGRRDAGGGGRVPRPVARGRRARHAVPVRVRGRSRARRWSSTGSAACRTIPPARAACPGRRARRRGVPPARRRRAGDAGVVPAPRRPARGRAASAARTLVCPLHGRAFDLDTGEGDDADTTIATYAVRIGSDGDIVVSVGDDRP